MKDEEKIVLLRDFITIFKRVIWYMNVEHILLKKDNNDKLTI